MKIDRLIHANNYYVCSVCGKVHKLNGTEIKTSGGHYANWNCYQDRQIQILKNMYHNIGVKTF